MGGGREEDAEDAQEKDSNDIYHYDSDDEHDVRNLK